MTNFVAPRLLSATLNKVLARPIFLIAALLIAAPQAAQAGLFGGFAKNGEYRRGSDKLCQPVKGTNDASKCDARTPAELAKIPVDKGTAQYGSGKKLSVRAKGTRLEVIPEGAAEPLFVWDSGEVLGAVSAVYLDGSGRYVAVEYSTRFAGREVDDLVVLQLKDGLGGTSSTGAATSLEDSVPAAPVPAVPTEDPPAFVNAMKTGVLLAKRGKQRKAIAAFIEALTHSPEHPEALYHLAHSQFSARDKKAALESLARIPRSKHRDAARWRVEARVSQAFRSLRGDLVFRKAVGIERTPGEVVSAYERLVSLGGRWEQESLPCEQPRVNLDLARNEKRRFDLVIRSQCQGSIETTRLDGSWRSSGTGDLQLRFPNTQSADEELKCVLELCEDGSEDCLRCQLETLEFLLRIVRR